MIHGTIDHDQNRNATIFEFSSDGDPKAKYTCKLDNDKFNDCELLKITCISINIFTVCIKFFKCIKFCK